MNYQNGILMQTPYNEPVYLEITPTLNTLRRAKHPYNKPIGYATSSLWFDIRSTATNIPDAAYVHQRMEMRDSKYPILPLYITVYQYVESRKKWEEVGWKDEETYSNVKTTLMAPTPTIGNKQYPRTDATRYASIPDSDIKLSRTYIDTDPSNATPYM